MPLHSLLTMDAQQSIQQDALQGREGGKQLINYFVGQSVGMFDQIRPCGSGVSGNERRVRDHPQTYGTVSE